MYLGWYIVISTILSGIITQIGLTTRLKIREKNKLKRIQKLEQIENSKINEIGNYESKSNNKIISRK